MSFTINFGPFNASLKNKIIVIKILLTPNWHCIIFYTNFNHNNYRNNFGMLLNMDVLMYLALVDLLHLC